MLDSVGTPSQTLSETLLGESHWRAREIGFCLHSNTGLVRFPRRTLLLLLAMGRPLYISTHISDVV